MTASYFEWVQDFSIYFCSETDVNANLERVMSEGFRAVWDLAADRNIPLRTARIPHWLQPRARSAPAARPLSLSFVGHASLAGACHSARAHP